MEMVNYMTQNRNDLGTEFKRMIPSFYQGEGEDGGCMVDMDD